MLQYRYNLLLIEWNMALRNFTNPNTPERQAIKRNMEVTAEITKLSELEIKTWLEE